jgi:hypothetical protein
MKKTIITAACSVLALVAQAQNRPAFKDKKTIIQVGKTASSQDTVPSTAKTIIQIGSNPVQDSVALKGKTIIQIGKTITIRSRNSDATVTLGPANTDVVKPKKSVSIGFDFTRFDLGFSRYLDQGSFTLSPANANLDFLPSKTSNVGFDFFQFKYKASDKFRFYIGAGLDWNHIRLNNNVTFQKNQATLTATQEVINFTKNRFSSRYLRIPIGFDFTKTIQNDNKLHVVLGPELGFLLNGKVKQESKERGKEKFKDDYNFNPFRYGGFVRVGYKGWGIYTKYYFNDVFAKGQGPADLKNMSFGLSMGF